MGFIRKAFDQDLSANESYTIALAGDYVRVVASTGEVEVRTDQGDVLNLQQGMGVHRPGRRWSSLTLTDKSGATNSVELVIGDGVVLDDNRTSINGTVTVQEVLPDNYTANGALTPAASTATSLGAASSDRLAMYVRSDPANTADVFIGNSGVGSDKAILLQPGEAITAETDAVLYCWTSGTSQKIHRCEIRGT